MSTQRPSKAPQLIVRRLSDAASRGFLQCGNLRFPCALGRSGLVALKCEGDDATPRGRFALCEVLFDPRAVGRPSTPLSVMQIGPDDGWCDDPRDRNYNRQVKHPYPASAEHLARGDGLYDIVIVLAYNTRPRIRGRGSAIFIHVARQGFMPTEGCIALRRADLQRLLLCVRRGSHIVTAL